MLSTSFNRTYSTCRKSLTDPWKILMRFDMIVHLDLMQRQISEDDMT